MAPRTKRVCIVGAGVIGLTTAYTLLSNNLEPSTNVARQNQPIKDHQYDITIITDRPMEDITSIGPPGIFRPGPTGESIETCRRWSKISQEIFTKLIYDESANESGIQLVSGYILSDNLDMIHEMFQAFNGLAPVRMLTPGEIPACGQSQPKKYGVFCTSYTSEGGKLVPWLRKRVTEMGARIVLKKLSDLKQVQEHFDIVVNCSGLGSGQLVGDTSVEPIRGILVKVKAPWVKHFYYYEDDRNYIIPGVDCVYLGGVREVGNYDTKVAKEEIDKILHNTSLVVPSLKNAKIVSTWVGLRPGRKGGPRVEKDSRGSNNKCRALLIHNYGHAGSGFIKSWGCAQDVKKLIEEKLMSNL